jgi:hypothetical protein
MLGSVFCSPVACPLSCIGNSILIVLEETNESHLNLQSVQGLSDGTIWNWPHAPDAPTLLFSKAVELRFSDYARNVGYITVFFISGRGQIEGFCECGNEPSVYKKYKEFLD